MGKFMALDNNLKKDVVKKFGKTENDCGSTRVQIALLTANINNLKDHFAKNSKDTHSRRGLLKMVMKRKSLMKYLKNKDISNYEELVQQLGLRK